MNSLFSQYLNILRLLASLLVFLSHYRHLFPVEGQIFGMGHEAVIIFFVMSGLVISYTAEVKDRTAVLYGISRFSRIYSVVLPAVFFTLCFDYIGTTLGPEIYTGRNDAFDLPFVRLISSLLFTNELWWVSIQSFSNIPYWSLNYEVWYYVIFAAAFYCPRPHRYWVLALAVLVAGIKIILLLPIWLAGAGLWALIKREWQPNVLFGFILMASSFIGIWCYFSLNISAVASGWLAGYVDAATLKALAYSKNFLSDYYMCVMVSGMIYGTYTVTNHWRDVKFRSEPFIAKLADYTFIIYLLHQPTLLVVKAVSPFSENQGADMLFGWTVSLGLIVVIHEMTKNHRFVIKRKLSNYCKTKGWL